MKTHQFFTGPRGSGKTTKVREIAAQFQPDQVAFIDFYPPNFHRQLMELCSVKTALIVIEGYYESLSGDSSVWIIMAMAANGFGLQPHHMYPQIIITSTDEICEKLTGSPKFSTLFEQVHFLRA